MYKVGVVMVAYGLADASKRLFESTRSVLWDVEYHLFLHSRKPDVVAACEKIAATRFESPHYGRSAIAKLHKDATGEELKTFNHGRVIYYSYGANRGLSNSWNEGVLAAYANGCDTVLIVNDDVEFERDSFNLLVAYALDHPEYYMVDCAGWNERLKKETTLEYSCFALNPIALEKIGCFDQNFFPIYFEDCDFAYRAKLAGLEAGHCDYAHVRHGGSMTINTDPVLEQQHHQTFVRNRDYYVKKWGGEPHNERYQVPFNDAELGLRIAPETRHQPYGVKYDRTDFEIVKV